MRRVVRYTISKESYEDMIKAGRFNPCLEITFWDKHGKHTHKLQTGYEDYIHVFRECGETFVLSQNHRLDYIGLEMFKSDTKTGSIFLQEYTAKEVLGRMDLAPFTIIRRIMNYFLCLLYPDMYQAN